MPRRGRSDHDEPLDSPDSRVPPRRAIPVRRLTTVPDQPPDARILLSQIISVLLGLLVGLFVANGISEFFTNDFRQSAKEGEALLLQATKGLEEGDLEWKQVVDKRRDLQDQLEAYVGTDTPPPELRDEVARVEAQYRALQADRDEFESQQNFWKGQLPSIYDQIQLLNLSSAVLLLIMGLFGYLSYPLTLRWFNRMVDNWVMRGDQPRTSQLLIGFFAGLNMAVVILLAVNNTFNFEHSFMASPMIQLLFGAAMVLGLGVVGALTGATYFGPAARRHDPYRDFRSVIPPKILDSSVLIDGRLFEVATSGFLDGQLVVPSSVLRELQALADSGDGRRRSKGRRGLELVRSMQDDPRIEIKVFDDAPLYEAGRSTDDQLITIARTMAGVVVTNDFNLNRVAAIHNVRVLNLNALTQAVKTRLLPGDMLELDIVDRGKQRGQGVGYLDDGTMVVVEDGEPWIGQHRTVKLTSVTQTQQGRLMFGRVDLAEEDGETGNGRHI